MAKKLNSLDDAPIDVFEAVKRAFIKRGFIRRRGVRPSEPPAPKRRQPKPTPPLKEDEKPESEEAKQATLKPAEGIAVLPPEEDPEMLVNLAQNSQETLIEASTVFPLTLIPDTITVDREKLTIAKRSFIRIASVNSTPITDIQSVEVDVGPFFGTVKLTSKYFVNNQREVRFLWRDDAIKIHHLLQGLILAHQRQVDINTLDKEQLILLLHDLGQGVSD